MTAPAFTAPGTPEAVPFPDGLGLRPNYRVTVSRPRGPSHPAVCDWRGNVLELLCRCPGHLSGRLFKGQAVVAHGHAAATCGCR